jgi:hypothetical protein
MDLVTLGTVRVAAAVSETLDHFDWMLKKKGKKGRT